MSKKLNYPHLLNRVCNAPLMIEQRHLQPLLAFLGPRIGVDFQVPLDAAAAAEANESSARNFADIPDNIAMVDVSGPLVRRASGLDAWCGMASYEQIEKDFAEAINDNSKQAVLMLFDSPGGEVGGLFDLADLIHASRGKKPIYAAVSEMAFSAAYALASACDRIFLTRTAGVGSIGVFTMHLDMSEMDKKEGLSFTYVYAGDKKVEGNPHEPLSKDAKGTIQAEVDRSYDLFVETVARNRSISAKSVKNTQAGLYFGAEALDVKLADEIGTVSDAVAALDAAIKAAASPAPAKRAEVADLPLAAEAANPTQETQMSKIDPASVSATAADTGKECDDEDAKKGKATPPADEKKKDEDEDDAKKAADAKEVVFLCKVAGRSDLVAGFIEKGSTLAQVRSDLLKAQADSEQAPGAIGHHVSHTGINPTDQLDSLAKQRATQKNISYSKAYGEVMKENPKLYTQYLDQKDALTAPRR